MLSRSFKSHAGKLVMLLAVAVAFAFVGNVDASAKVKYYKVKGKWVGFDKSTGYLKWSGGLSYVPKKVAGKKVKTIGEWAYSNNKNIKTANIPSSVKKIEKGEIRSFDSLLRLLRTLGKLDVLQSLVEEEQLSPNEYYQLVQSSKTNQRKRAVGKLNAKYKEESEW